MQSSHSLGSIANSQGRRSMRTLSSMSPQAPEPRILSMVTTGLSSHMAESHKAHQTSCCVPSSATAGPKPQFCPPFLSSLCVCVLERAFHISGIGARNTQAPRSCFPKGESSVSLVSFFWDKESKISHRKCWDYWRK